MALVRFTTPGHLRIFRPAPPRGALTYRLVPITPREESPVVAPLKVVGYAARFFELSATIWRQPRSPFRMMIWPGAFRESVRDDDVTFNPDHGATILGSTGDGALKLEEDKAGLRFEFTPPRGPAGDAFVDRVRRGAFGGVSMRFSAGEELWLDQGTELIQAVKKIDLIHVSPVAHPAFTTTSIQIEGG